MSQKKAFARLFVSSLCVVLVALMLTGAVELGLDYYKDGSTASLKVSNEMTKRKTELLLLTAEALAELDSENAQEAKKYYEALALKEALEGQADFYQSYKNRKDYHYFGKYYELFNNVYGADTLILGSSLSLPSPGS